jgi:hypothetical protein
MDESQKYLFNLNGYIIIPNVINKKFITKRQKLLFEPPYHNRRNSFL